MHLLRASYWITSSRAAYTIVLVHRNSSILVAYESSSYDGACDRACELAYVLACVLACILAYVLA